MMKPHIEPGIYDALLDYSLQDILVRHPELHAVLGKIDVEEQPARYAVFVARILKQSLPGSKYMKSTMFRIHTTILAFHRNLLEPRGLQGWMC